MDRVNGPGNRAPDAGAPAAFAGAGSRNNLERQWPAIRRLFLRAFLSSLHYAIASVDEHGDPHVTPIGTLILGEPGVAIFFERFTTGLPANLEANNRVCILR